MAVAGVRATRMQAMPPTPHTPCRLMRPTTTRTPHTGQLSPIHMQVMQRRRQPLITPLTSSIRRRIRMRHVALRLMESIRRTNRHWHRIPMPAIAARTQGPQGVLPIPTPRTMPLLPAARTRITRGQPLPEHPIRVQDTWRPQIPTLAMPCQTAMAPPCMQVTPQI